MRYVLTNYLLRLTQPFRHGPLITARTFWGDTLMVVFPTYRSVYQFGILDSWELIVQKTLVDRLHKGDVFIDVGANVGFYTLLASALVGDTGQVHSFEPTPSTFAVLKENRGERTNIHLNQLALGEQEGEATLADFGLLDSGLNSLHTLEHKGIRSEKITVKITTLDSYCKEKNLKPTMIKVDVEGMEYEVLQGAVETLRTARPVLILEVGAYEAYASLFVFLRANGYDAYRSTESLTLVPYTEDHTHRRMNMVFIPHQQSV